MAKGNGKKQPDELNDVKEIEIPPPDEEELFLEKLVFGDTEGFETNLKQIDNLYSYDSEDEGADKEQLFTYDDSSDDDEHLDKLRGEIETEDAAQNSTDDEQDDEVAQLDDDQLYFMDEGDSEEDEDKMEIDSEEASSASASENESDEVAWKDSDDENVSVSLMGSDKLRKLRKTQADDQVRGRRYIQRLRTQFEKIYPKPLWADEFEGESGAESGAEEVEDDDDNVANGSRDVLASSNPLLQFLKSNQTYNVSGQDRKLIPAGKIDISRLTDANIKKLSQSAIQTMCFHRTHPLLLTGGYDRTLRIYHVDGKVNNVVTSLHLRNTPVQTAAFVDNTIFAGGRRRFMHKWDISGGSIEKISRMYGHESTQRSFENFKVSDNGKYLGLVGNSGWINIISPKTGMWLRGFKVEGTLVDFDFSRNENSDADITLAAVNSAGEVWEFKVGTGEVMARWSDESGIGVTKVRFGGYNSRWLAIGNNVGIVSVYDRQRANSNDAVPKPIGVVESLVTTISSIEFTHDGQVMCVASRDKKDALRLVHLPTCRVFSNWPTSGTPLGRVTSACFSPGGEILATGNEAGRVRLWRLNHY